MYANFDNQILSQYTATDLLFVIGAGISKNPPSNIPLGEELTKFILDISCGKSESNVFVETWRSFSNTIQEYNKYMVFSIPRLETILGCIDEMDNMLERNSILQGIAAWSNTPPNDNHDYLATFLRNGSNIVTTNFDLGIENAYSKQYGALDRTIIDGISIFSSDASGQLCHIHGCALDDSNQLGATMKKVKTGFGTAVEMMLKSMVTQSKLIIFLGYSVSDSFDITPFFESTSCPSVLYVQHSTNSNVNYPANLDRVVRLSKEAFRIGLNTTEFLKDISIRLLGYECPFERSEKKELFDWKKSFNELSSYNREDQIINFMCLRYHLGISTDIFLGKRSGIIDEIKYVYNKMNIKNQRIHDYYTQAIRSFSVLVKRELPIPEETVPDKVDFINKDYLILLRNECEYYIDKYSDISLNIGECDRLRMEWLFGLLVSYSSYTYRDVQYVSYISASLKYASAFCARLNKGYHPEYAEKELILALEISYIEGTIAALIHLAQHCLVYGELNSQIDLYKENAEKALMTAYKLSMYSGYIYHIKRIQTLNDSFNLGMSVPLVHL